MSGWVKIPEDWTGDDRVERLGADAAMLHLSALGHSARYLHDGMVSKSALRKLWPAEELDAALAKLVELEFWEDRGDSYYLPEWRTHILAADEVEHRREQDRARQQRKRRHDSGDHSLCDRCSFVRSHGVTPPVTNSVSHETVTRPEPNRPEPDRTVGERSGRCDHGHPIVVEADGTTTRCAKCVERERAAA